MKKIGLFLGLLFVLAFAGASCNNSNENSNNQTEPTATESQVAGASSTEKPEYFSDDAKVMFFYSDYCSWCVKQKEVLAELGKEGYRVKPMNVGENQDLWKQYNIEGTPTLIAPDGTKSTGYAEKDRLRTFLDKYK